MKEQELRQEYLNIASPRISRKGDRTPNLNRLVKGRRGVGKFSGLILADVMEVVTRAHGTQTRITISKTALLAAGKDIEHVPLPVEVDRRSLTRTIGSAPVSMYTRRNWRRDKFTYFAASPYAKAGSTVCELLILKIRNDLPPWRVKLGQDIQPPSI